MMKNISQLLINEPQGGGRADVIALSLQWTGVRLLPAGFTF